MRKYYFVIVQFLLIINLQASERIISLAPAVTEMIYYLGGEENLVGVTNVCDFPEAAKSKEKIGDFTFPNTEKIISMKPTIIIGMDLNEEKMKKFKDFGINYKNIKIKKIDDIFETMQYIGKIIKREEYAEKKIKLLRERVLNIKTKGKKIEEKPLVLVVIWDKPLITAGSKSIINEMILSAGGKNLGSIINSEYPVVSKEQIIKNKPDFILLEESVNIKNIGINSENAVRIKIDMDTILRPGPRMMDGMEKLYETFDNFKKK